MQILINCILILFSMLNFFIIAHNLYPYKKNLRIKILIPTLAITYLLSVLLGMELKIIVPLLSMSGAGVSLYLSDRKKFLSVIVCAITGLMFLALDLFCSNIVSLIFHDPNTFFANTFNNILFCITIMIIAYFVSLLLGNFARKRFRFDNMEQLDRTNKVLIAVLFIFGLVLFLMIINLLVMEGYDTSIILIFSLLFLAYLVLIAIILARLFKSVRLSLEIEMKEKELKNKETLLASLREYTGELEHLYDNMRVFRHDYINILSTLSSYMEEQDWENLVSYFRERILPIGSEMDRNNYRLGLLKNIKVLELKGIISTKAIYAQEKNICFLIDIAQEIKAINMDIIDLSKSIGIILDNAIESSIESNEKYVKCGIIQKEHSTLIVVINSHSGTKIDVRQIYKKGYSTKSSFGKNRGLGLYTLKNIVEKNEHVTLETEITREEFKLCLEIME